MQGRDPWTYPRAGYVTVKIFGGGLAENPYLFNVERAITVSPDPAQDHQPHLTELT